MEIILLILFVWGLFYFNGRISALEKNVENIIKSKLVSQGQMTKPISVPESVSSIATELDSQEALSSQQIPEFTPSSTSDNQEAPEAPKQRESGEVFGGQLLGKIGIIALVIGLSFFLKYAFENNWIGATGRVMIGLFVGVALIGIGQFLRKNYLVYSDFLMGGGIAALYLSIFAAFNFYALIDAPVAFFFMICVTVLSVVISIVDGTINLAILGVLGGFITPFLVNTGSNNFVLLFSYSLIIDFGVLALSVFKKWTKLNYLAFVCTYLIFFGWLTEFYNSLLLGSTMFFLTAFFVVFLFVTIIHNIFNQKKSREVDIVLLTLNTFIYAVTSYFLLNDKYHSYLGFFAVLLAVVYFAIAYLADKYNSEDNVLSVALLGLGATFLTVAIPLQLTGYWITLAWLVEAVVLYYISSEVESEKLQPFGTFVYSIGVARFFIFDSFNYSISRYTVIFNRQFFLVFVAVVVAYLLSYFHKKGVLRNPANKQWMAIFLVVANLLTLYAFTTEADRYYRKQLDSISTAYNKEVSANNQYGKDAVTREKSQEYYAKMSAVRNKENTAISIIWALYAVILVAFGFMWRVRMARIFGLTLLFITALKIFVDVWALGALYRIISSISFGVIALIVSFVFAKYKKVIQEIL